MSLHVLHCDNHLLAVIKPAGMPVVPDTSGDRSLLDEAKSWVKRKYDKPGDVFLGVVHRLDRPVSGIVVFGRTSKGASRLSAAWREGKVRKRYQGWSPLRPELTAESGELQLWQRRAPERNQVLVLGVAPPVVEVAEGEESESSQPVAPHREAQRAITRWRLLRQDRQGSFLELEPVTGRKHQLRLACRFLGMPLAGDVKYGAPTPLRDLSIGLCATELEVPHPTKPEQLSWRIDPPWDV